MGTQSDSADTKSPAKVAVDLVPWDPDSPQHIERLVEQRVQCGWNAHKVATIWHDMQKAGTKCVYWILLRGDDERQRQLLAQHVSKHPLEAEPLQDTATSIRGVARAPTNAQILPVGHISLDTDNPDAKPLGLDLPDTGVYWISSFYVSYALQGLGLGRAAMDTVETMAVTPPLYAQVFALDTVLKDDQTTAEIAQAYYGAMPKIVNQSWYERRGYKQIKIVPDYYQAPDRSGKIWSLRTVFMRRDLDQSPNAGTA